MLMCVYAIGWTFFYYEVSLSRLLHNGWSLKRRYYLYGTRMKMPYSRMHVILTTITHLIQKKAYKTIAHFVCVRFLILLTSLIFSFISNAFLASSTFFMLNAFRNGLKLTHESIFRLATRATAYKLPSYNFWPTK